MGGLISPKPDKSLQKQQQDLQKRQEKQIDQAEKESNRLRQRAAGALRAMRAGNSAFTFAGPAGLADTLGAGGVRG